MKTLVSLIIAVSLTIAVGHASNGRPAIKVGSEVEFPPFAVIDENGRADGFSVDLIKAVAKAMDLPIVITTGSWDTMWNGLVSGQLDILPIVAKSPERRRLVDFSLSHTETFDSFFVRSGSAEIRDIESAQGKKIVVMRSDAAHHALLDHNFRGEIALVDTIPEGLKMVASGGNDAFLCSKLIGVLAIKKHSIKGLKAGPLVPDYKRVFSFGVRKGEDELREKLNQGLLMVKSSGEYDRIYEKWLGFDDPWHRYKRYLPVALAVLGAIASAAILWSAMLRLMVKRRTAELAVKNESLEQEIRDRRRIEEELSRHREELELRIEERTKELRESTEISKAILAAVPDIIMQVDNSKIYTWANKAGFEFFGDDVLGMEADFYFEGEQETYGKVQSLFNGDESVFYVESWQRRKDGDKRLLAWWCRALKDPEGNVTGALSTARDVTESRKADEQLKQYSSELEKSNKELQKTLAEIRTLRGILPICSYCKKIRNDKGAWEQMELYIRDHSEAEFSHGMCPECAEKAMKNLEEFKKKNPGPGSPKERHENKNTEFRRRESE